MYEKITQRFLKSDCDPPNKPRSQTATGVVPPTQLRKRWVAAGQKYFPDVSAPENRPIPKNPTVRRDFWQQLTEDTAKRPTQK